ncbi:hypothetical protein [Bacillus cereus]|nr:hypothetical protein [Bacillus cereus]
MSIFKEYEFARTSSNVDNTTLIFGVTLLPFLLLLFGCWFSSPAIF